MDVPLGGLSNVVKRSCAVLWKSRFVDISSAAQQLPYRNRASLRRPYFTRDQAACSVANPGVDLKTISETWVAHHC